VPLEELAIGTVNAPRRHRDRLPGDGVQLLAVADNLRVKKATIDGADARFIICHNPIQAERDAQRREQAIARIEAELERISTQRGRDAKTSPW
jgi:hypothetical protein